MHNTAWPRRRPAPTAERWHAFARTTAPSPADSPCTHPTVLRNSHGVRGRECPQLPDPGAYSPILPRGTPWGGGRYGAQDSQLPPPALAGERRQPGPEPSWSGRESRAGGAGAGPTQGLEQDRSMALSHPEGRCSLAASQCPFLQIRHNPAQTPTLPRSSEMTVATNAKSASPSCPVHYRSAACVDFHPTQILSG